MKDESIQELGKARNEQITLANICNSTVIGIFALWIIWVSTSLLIHIAR